MKTHTVPTLTEIAKYAMETHGLLVDFSPAALEQLQLIHQPAPFLPSPEIKDMREKLWFSIDNDDSRDLDQLTYAEELSPDRSKIYIAIADVDALVKATTPLDLQAGSNTTSVYTPTKVFPMLPEKLSTNLTSLNPYEERLAVVAEVDVKQDGLIDNFTVYQACVKSHAKLAYSGVGNWLEKKTSLPENISKVKGLKEQLLLHDKIAQQLHSYRQQHGSLSLGTIEIVAVLSDDQVVGLREGKRNRAHDIIENFMIAANIATTRFLESMKFPTFRRIVRRPKRWERIVGLAEEYGETLPKEPDSHALEAFLVKRKAADPERFPDLSLAIIKLLGRGEYVVRAPGEPPIGHFGLALRHYSHSTAPNRRYSDLINQRLLKAALTKKNSIYSLEDLRQLAEHCTHQEDAADKVQRSVVKSAAAIVLSPHVTEIFEGFITGSNENGTWVRLLNPPAEGKVVKGFEGLDVGDRVKVKLIHVDIFHGYIDFEVVKKKY